jgi:hypothetical protein
MYFKKGLLILALIMGVTSALWSQSLGTWNLYLNLNQAVDIALVEERVFVATANSMFVYQKNDNSISKISKLNGLSDIGIVSLFAHNELNLLFVGYQNGNLDIIDGNTITNFAELKNSSVIGDKAIRHIYFDGNTAYISTGLGILNFNIERREVRDTYSILPGGSLSVNESCVVNDTLYAATAEGLYFGSIQDDLTIFSNWQQDFTVPEPFSNMRNCASYLNRLYVNVPQASSPGLYYKEGVNWTIVNGTPDIRYLRTTPGGLVLSAGYYGELKTPDGLGQRYTFFGYDGQSSDMRGITAAEDGEMFIGDGRIGMVIRSPEGSFEIVTPDGPGTGRAFDLDFKNKTLWVASGAVERPGTWNNFFRLDGFYKYQNGSWTNFTSATHPELLSEVFFDVVKAYADPSDANNAYFGSYFRGLTKVEGDEIVAFYDDTNSSLEEREEFNDPSGIPWVGVAGMVKDNDGNLWVTNAHADRPLSVLQSNGIWRNFGLEGSGANGPNQNLLEIIIDQQDQKWMIVNRNGILVYSDNGTVDDESDDEYRRMEAVQGRGGLPDNEVVCMAEDLDGEIWVGTTNGVGVFFSPFDALTDDFSDARQILVEQDGVFQFLFEGQTVTAIAIDGANRKWFGTRGSGVFLLSEDGTEEIRKFTTENSPLLSDNITDIVIDPESGEVFIGTEQGIVSYIGDATQGSLQNDCSTVYPNPVRENYTGPIAISGLKRDSEIRITDVRGNLIFSTVSNGGKAIWDGKNLDGQRVATGVYFALSSDSEGESTCVSKILIVK